MKLVRKSSVKKVLAISLVLALLLSGCNSGGEIQADAEVSLGTAVEVQKLKKSSIQNELTYIGQVSPQQSIAVASKLSAEVLSVNFEVGDYVNAGDVLFTVDAKDIQDQIRQLQASAAQTELLIEKAEYGLEVAQEGSVQEELNAYQYQSGINEARAGVQTAQDAKENYKDARDRYEDEANAYHEIWQSELAKRDQWVQENQTAVANGESEPHSADKLAEQQEKINEALKNYTVANGTSEKNHNDYQSSNIGINKADRALGLAYDSYDTYKDFVEESRERSVKQAEFGVSDALAAQNVTQVQLSIAQSNLGNAVVTSPISGVISQRNIEAGQLISPSVMPFTIVKMDTVNVVVNVSETLINSIHAGDEVQVVIQALGEEPLTGIVTVVSPVAGSNSTYPIQVQLDNSDGMIKPGMFSQVSFVQAQKDNTFVVDKNVVMRDETTQYVYVIENGAAKKVTVTTGLTNGEEIEILSGVKAGDEIVVVGQEYLDNNTSVNIVKRDGVDVRGQSQSVAELETQTESDSNEADEEDVA